MKFCVLVCIICGFVVAQQPVKPNAKRVEMPTVDAALDAKLTKLRPDNPEGYFLLAEEVSEVVEDEPRLNLARTLFVLAFELDRRRGGSGSTLAPGAVLGIARIERLDRDKRWLTAVAGAIDKRYSLPDWNVGAVPSISDEAAYRAATVLGLTRSGDGRDAKRTLDQAGVGDVLTRYERAIGTTGETGALSRLDKYMQQWPCPECGNQRYITRPGDKGVEVRLCPSCGGNPGPRLAYEEYIGQLRFEAALLNGIQRSWAAQVVVDQSSPLRDPDIEELAPTYGVDVSKPYWRQGQWVASP